MKTRKIEKDRHSKSRFKRRLACPGRKQKSTVLTEMIGIHVSSRWAKPKTKRCTAEARFRFRFSKV